MELDHFLRKQTKQANMTPNLLSFTIFQLSIITLLPILSSAAQPSYKALVTPITKDASTSLYTITLNNNQSYVIDLASPLPWHRCRRRQPLVPCSSPACSSAQSFRPPSCPVPVNNPTPKCTCTVTPSNPVTKACVLSKLSFFDVEIPWTDGHNPEAQSKFSNLLFSCAPKSLFGSLPSGASGVASFSQAPLSLPTQFHSKVEKQFALCLPGSLSAPGVGFFGSGPFYLLPPPGRDVTQFLQFTPFLKHRHATSPDYYIPVKSVNVNGVTNKSLRVGRGGAKLSTVVPYTSLRSSIYRAFLEQFSSGTSGVPRVSKVKPFDLCLNSTFLASTRVGWGVPQVDLELVSGRNWTIFGSNSMVQVSAEVACLGFVDGGKKAEPPVVIGSYQMQDNFLLFDVAGSRLGFSSSLLFTQTTCSNFNFTSGN